MKKSLWLLFFFLFSCTGEQETSQFDYLAKLDTKILELVAAVAIDYSEPVEPSGLIMRNDSLFTVSDDHDHTIFYLDVDLENKTGRLIPFIKFEAPELDGIDFLDFEGITVDPAGNFYLVSEQAFRILKISAGGQIVEWITPNLKPFGEKAGLFQRRNANFEALTRIEGNQFVLCAERQPRGMIRLDTGTMPQSIVATKQDHSILPAVGKRTPDYAGLHFDGTHLFALERAIGAVTQIDLSDKAITETALWTYAHVENDSAWRYEEMEYGHAEGLFLDDDFVYMVLDNNGAARQNDKNDTRPVLFIFNRPEN
ncbi:MAG: hypothetical protein DWQ05_06435 [Calditrichaeota bacterium]|nr:MAG: hypothetical protein DWQ05_06435 [Calditrichota bacterium]